MILNIKSNLLYHHQILNCEKNTSQFLVNKMKTYITLSRVSNFYFTVPKLWSTQFITKYTWIWWLTTSVTLFFWFNAAAEISCNTTPTENLKLCWTFIIVGAKIRYTKTTVRDIILEHLSRTLFHQFTCIIKQITIKCNRCVQTLHAW